MKNSKYGILALIVLIFFLSFSTVNANDSELINDDIEMLNYYFGFGKDKRYSIFEIEDMLKLENGQGEELFQNTLLVLSTVEGKMFL